MSDTNVGTASGLYSVLLTVRPGLASAILQDLQGAKRGGFARAFAYRGLGKIERAPLPSNKLAAIAQITRDDKLLVTTTDPQGLRDAVLFNPSAKQYRSDTGVLAFRFAD